jgi:ferrous iron transport protein B
MLKKIALVGQPNAGKTTLFNRLTNSDFKTGNYPGITVDFNFGKLAPKFTKNIVEIYDTPGLNSLNTSSEEEKLTTFGIFEKHSPNIIVSVVDATQLSRQLYLTMQLKKAGFNVVVALTMLDICEKKSSYVDVGNLSEIIGLPVFAASTENDVEILAKNILELVEKYNPITPKLHKYFSDEAIINSYNFLKTVETQVITTSEKRKEKFSFDSLALHPIWGVLTFFIIMGGLFSSIFWLAEPFMDFIDSAFISIQELLRSHLPPSMLTDLLVDGLVAGMGAVAVFLPQISILFLIMGILEDIGYLSRAAVIVDLPFSKLGLSGRSFIPLLSGFACAVPAVMAARTLKNKRERFLSMFIIPLMSCSARLPVFVILISLVVPSDKPWIGGFALLVIYLFTLFTASLIAGIIGKFMKDEDQSQFALELPMYRKPIFKVIFKSVYMKSKEYLKEAGSVIVFISIIMWALASYNVNTTDGITKTENIENSILGKTGHFIEPALEPMGIDWRVGVAITASFTAREIFVGTLVQIFRITEKDENAQNESLIKVLKEARNKNTGELLFSRASIFALAIFYIFALLCFPTLVVSAKEFKNWKIPIIQFFSFTGLGYIGAIFVYQLLK